MIETCSRMYIQRPPHALPCTVSCIAASYAQQLPIAIGGGAVALLIVVGLAAFCMRKSNKEAGADNVQPVQLGSELHDDQIDVSLGVEPKDDFGDLKDAATTYVRKRRQMAGHSAIPSSTLHCMSLASIERLALTATHRTLALMIN